MWIILAGGEAFDQFAKNFWIAGAKMMQPLNCIRRAGRRNSKPDGRLDQPACLRRVKGFDLDLLESHQQRPDAANVPGMFRADAQPHRRPLTDAFDE